jgi:hypothetical protein
MLYCPCDEDLESRGQRVTLAFNALSYYRAELPINWRPELHHRGESYKYGSRVSHAFHVSGVDGSRLCTYHGVASGVLSFLRTVYYYISSLFI